MYRAEILIGLQCGNGTWKSSSIHYFSRAIIDDIREKQGIEVQLVFQDCVCMYATEHAATEPAINVIVTVNPHKPTGTLDHLIKAATIYKCAMKEKTGNYVIPGIILSSAGILDITPDQAD